MTQIGITERGDAALDTGWIPWVLSGKPAILISKDPLKLLHILNTKVPASLHSNIIMHATITGHAGTELEPNVPKIDNADEFIRYLNGTKLAKKVLRVDPILPYDNGPEIAVSVIKTWQNYFDEVRISFIDNYPHVSDRGLHLPWQGIHAPVQMRISAYNKISGICTRTLNVCGEPGFDCNGCVSKSDLAVLNINEAAVKGGMQRPVCACAAQKFELLTNKHQCKHGCLYCYWQ